MSQTPVYRKEWYQHIFSNYCGLGGDGPTEHAVDRACKKHDEGYQALTDQGINPYWQWNQYDLEFMNDIADIYPESYREAFIKDVAKSTFTMKKAINPALQSIGKVYHQLMGTFIIQYAVEQERRRRLH
jgi:hypothetical protein